MNHLRLLFYCIHRETILANVSRMQNYLVTKRKKGPTWQSGNYKKNKNIFVVTVS